MQQSMQHLFERIQAGLICVDESGRIHHANRFILALLQYNHDEFIGKSVGEVFKDLAYAGQLSEQLPLSTTTQAKRKNGAVLNVDVKIDPADALNPYTLLTITDTTDREVALSTLQQSQVINKTGTWQFDLQANEVWWSPELFRIFQLPVADLAPPYDTHRALFTDASWAKLEPAVAAASEFGTPYELELTLNIKTADDVNRVAVARCEPQLSESGEVIRLIGTFQDITELAIARRERDQSLERLELAKKAARIGIWEWNLNDNQVVWDEQMYAMYGLDRPPTTYEDWRNAVHPEDRQRAEDELFQAIDKEGIFDSNFKITRQGEIRFIQAFAAANHGKMIGVNIDVTDQTKLREEIRRMNNLESLGALAGGIAHDFNNQLANINARAELLSIHADDSGFVRKVATDLNRAVDNAQNLTKQLLTFAKGGAPVKQTTSVLELVRENTEFSLRGAAMGVKFHLDENLWNANVDPHQIGQVIQNIVINAVQAMSDHNGTLTIHAHNTQLTTHPILSSGQYVQLDFEDNGPGMDDDLLAKIFDPYFTTKSEGHGLGLAICHSIISQHGGLIKVKSAAESGTCFTILLPATDAQAPQVIESKSLNKGSGRILIVDDMEDVLESLGVMVEALGYTTELANNVEDATHIYHQSLSQHTPFDLVITDLTMPGSGGGIELLSRLKVLNPQAKVVVVTGYGHGDTQQLSCGCDFAGRLTKPCKLAQLDAEIHKVING